MSFIPKYQKILELLLREVEKGKPGDRLPSVRTMMDKYKSSQSTIERCLDELTRQGLVRRERGSGIFVQGVEPRSKMLGVYTDGDVAPYSNVLFLNGVRATAEKHGFHVADFGPRNLFDRQEAVLAEMENLGFAGIIAALSTANFFHLESEQLLARFKHLQLPIVTCFPIPSVTADSVMPDYFSSFSALGTRLKSQMKGPVKYLGHYGIPSLARLQGLRVGLSGVVQHVDAEILDKSEWGVYDRVKELVEEGWEGNLVVGVPPDMPGIVNALQGGPWSKDSNYELAIALEEGDELPPGIRAHVVVRPSFKMGATAAEMLLRRIRGFRGEMTHTMMKHKLVMASRPVSQCSSNKAGALPELSP